MDAAKGGAGPVSQQSATTLMLRADPYLFTTAHRLIVISNALLRIGTKVGHGSTLHKPTPSHCPARTNSPLDIPGSLFVSQHLDVALPGSCLAVTSWHGTTRPFRPSWHRMSPAMVGSSGTAVNRNLYVFAFHAIHVVLTILRLIA